MEPAKMEMPKPGEAHRKLQLLEGRWIGEETLHPSPWDQAGGTAIGRVDNRLALEGFVIVQEYEQERAGNVTFRGHGVLGYDAAENSYVMHWWDSMGMPVNVFRGNFSDKVLKLTCKDSQGTSRVTFDLSEEGKYRFRMEVSQDETQWFTFMEGAYSRSIR